MLTLSQVRIRYCGELLFSMEKKEAECKTWEGQKICADCNAVQTRGGKGANVPVHSQMRPPTTRCASARRWLEQKRLHKQNDIQAQNAQEGTQELDEKAGSA